MAETILGIDLGTTNSEVAIIRDGQPLVLEDDGDPILPSVVGLSPDGRLLVGRAAKNQWVLAPERTIKSVKRSMGRDIKMPLGDQQFAPQEVSAMILRGLRDRAVKQVGEVKKAVITVPAYFNDAQRQATREAGELAGLEVVRILNEPTAAALAYDPHRTERRHVLVYDLGGGTFDVSVVLAEGGVVEVLASHGDTKLGGDDFDELLFQLLLRRFNDQHDVDLSSNIAARARLLRAAEIAKCQLSDHPFAKVEEEFLAEKAGVALHLNEEIGRPEYEALIMPHLQRTLDCIRRALEDAKTTAREIDEVLLVGGSTRTPLVGSLLEDKLGKPARREVNPELIVAMGAALQGGLVAGADVGAVLVDITPHSLGIRAIEDIHGFGMPFLHKFVPIVHRNSPLPANRSEPFRTVHDGQTEVEIEVFQGEDHDVRNNHAIGKFMISGLEPAPAGNMVLVQLDLTLDGTLKVAAREKATGLTKQITIDNALARFERDESAAARGRLDRLWEDSFGLPEPEEIDTDDSITEPSLAPGPREGSREAVQAKALLEKAERMLERVPADDKSELEKLMANVRTPLHGRDWNRVESATAALADALFYLEDA